MAQLVDLLLILAFALTALAGLKNGFFRELFSLVGLLVGVAAGMRFTGPILNQLPDTPFLHTELATAIVFLLVFLVAFALLVIGGNLLALVWEGKTPTMMSRLLGLGVGALRGTLLVTVLAGAIVLLAPWGSASLSDSRVLPFLSPGIEMGARLLPGDLGDRLRFHWDGLRMERDSRQATARAPGHV